MKKVRDEREMKRKGKKVNKVILLFLLILTAIIVVNISISKFESMGQLSGTSRVALMASDAYVDLDDDIMLYPGCEPKVYEVIITNKEENKICEVTQKYQLKIEKGETANLPIDISLYKDANCTQELIPNGNGYYSSDDYVLQAGVEESKIFYAKISWQNSSKNPSYAFEIDYFRIRIISEQVN